MLPFFTYWPNLNTLCLNPGSNKQYYLPEPRIKQTTFVFIPVFFSNMHFYIIEWPGSSTTTVSKKQEKRRMIASRFLNCRGCLFAHIGPKRTQFDNLAEPQIKQTTFVPVSFLNMNFYVIEGPGSITTTVSKKQEKRRMIASPFWNCRVPPFCAYWPNKNAICPSFFLLFSRKKWFVAWWLPDYYDCWLAITVVRCRVLKLLQVQAQWVNVYFCWYLVISRG